MPSTKTYRATAITPYGTFSKKRTKHRYAVVVVWHRAEQRRSDGTIAMPKATFVTWHRVGSRVPTSQRGATQRGVFPVVVAEVG